MYSKFHVISDLNLELFDRALDQHEIDNDVDYLILAGNLSLSVKRTLLYAETMASKYPNTNIIFNYGYAELAEKEYFKIKDAFLTRIKVVKKSPPNLYFPKGEIIGQYDFFSTEGFPQLTENEFNNSIYSKTLVSKFDQDIYIGDRLVCSTGSRYFDYDYYVNLQSKEKELLDQWANTPSGKKKILVTGFGVHSTYNYKDVTWISTGDQFVKQDLHITAPGLNRSIYLSI